MQTEIADPAMRREMQDAEAQMSSPKMQAQMREAQEAMNSPQMQEMMKQNPQMRAMIEAQMGALKRPAAKSGGGFGGMMPEGFVLKTKGLRTLVAVQGGMMASEVLTWSDKNVAYQLNREQQTYRLLPQGTDAKESPDAFKITRTSDTAKVLGYTCTRYLVESRQGRERVNYSIWATKEIKGFDPAKLRSLRMGREKGPNFMSQLDGVPMKMEMGTPEAKMTMEVTAITPGRLPDSTFELPSNFTESKY
jgi:hypothetical protein